MKRVWTIGILTMIKNGYLPNSYQKALLLQLPSSLKVLRQKLLLFLQLTWRLTSGETSRAGSRATWFNSTTFNF